MELASCGYCVFSISHSDGSADFTPSAGTFKIDFNSIEEYFKGK